MPNPLTQHHTTPTPPLRLLEQQKRQLAEAKRAHEEELRGIIRENQYIVEEFQQQMAKEKLTV